MLFAAGNPMPDSTYQERILFPWLLEVFRSWTGRENRVGGVPEYVSPARNTVVKGKVLDDWCRKLRDILADRKRLVHRRAETRTWGNGLTGV